VTPAFVDSGSTCTYIPKVYYNAILTEILKKATSHSYNSTWGTLVPCSDASKLDPIQFYYHNRWLEIQPANYLLDVGVSAGQTCSLCMYESAVTVDNKNYWLLGNNFMRGFYSVFDLDNTKFGFAPLAGSTATAPGSSAQYGGEPTTIMAENVKSPYATNDKKPDNKNKKDKKGFPWWGYLIIGVGSAIVIAVVIVIILECCSGDEEEEDADADTDTETELTDAVPKKKPAPVKPKTKPAPKPAKKPVPVEEEPLNEGDEDFDWNEGVDPNAPKDENGNVAVDTFMRKHIRKLLNKKSKKQTINKKGVQVLML